MGIRILGTVKHDGKLYDSNAFIPKDQISDSDLERLIRLGVAEKTQMVEAREKTPGLPGEVGGLDNPGDFATTEEIIKDIDEGFSHADLKRHAEVLEMTFPGNISKKDLIQMIVDEEKEDHFLDILEGL